MNISLEFQQVFLDLIGDLECKKSKIPKMIGIEYDVFTKIVEYGRIPKPVILVRIADFFGISVEYLLGRTKDTYFEKTKQPSTFQERFEQLREVKKMSYYAIAQKLHIPVTYVTNWEKRNFTPSLDNLILLSEIFEVSLDYLLGRTDDSTPYDDIDEDR